MHSVLSPLQKIKSKIKNEQTFSNRCLFDKLKWDLNNLIRKAWASNLLFVRSNAYHSVINKRRKLRRLFVL